MDDDNISVANHCTLRKVDFAYQMRSRSKVLSGVELQIEAGQVRKTHPFLPFILPPLLLCYRRSLCQDRLGTNIAKALNKTKEMMHALLFRRFALWSASPAAGNRRSSTC